jgi:hypothetical protein
MPQETSPTCTAACLEYEMADLPPFTPLSNTLPNPILFALWCLAGAAAVAVLINIVIYFWAGFIVIQDKRKKASLKRTGDSYYYEALPEGGSEKK